MTGAPLPVTEANNPLAAPAIAANDPSVPADPSNGKHVVKHDRESWLEAAIEMPHGVFKNHTTLIKEPWAEELFTVAARHNPVAAFEDVQHFADEPWAGNVLLAAAQLAPASAFANIDQFGEKPWAKDVLIVAAQTHPAVAAAYTHTLASYGAGHLKAAGLANYIPEVLTAAGITPAPAPQKASPPAAAPATAGLDKTDVTLAGTLAATPQQPRQERTS